MFTLFSHVSASLDDVVTMIRRELNYSWLADISKYKVKDTKYIFKYIFWPVEALAVVTAWRLVNCFVLHSPFLLLLLLLWWSFDLPLTFFLLSVDLFFLFCFRFFTSGLSSLETFLCEAMPLLLLMFMSGICRCGNTVATGEGLLLPKRLRDVQFLAANRGDTNGWLIVSARVEWQGIVDGLVVSQPLADDHALVFVADLVIVGLVDLVSEPCSGSETWCEDDM